MATLIQDEEVNMYPETTEAAYLEFMVHGDYNALVSLQASERLIDDELETIYALGYNYLTYGNYNAAKGIFTKLTKAAPERVLFWRSLGAVNRRLKCYPEAITAYDIAITKDETDIESYIYRGESCILFDKIEDGIKSLETAARIGATDPQSSAWVQRANLLLDLHKH